MSGKIRLHRGDLTEAAAEALRSAGAVAVDAEAMGLHVERDRLCLVQLSGGDGSADIVQLDRETFHCPHLSALLSDPNVLKILHFARFDLAMTRRWLGVAMAPVYCTKTVSRLTRTYTDRHGLKDLAKELLGIDLSKQQQSSDWGAEALSEAQLTYAAADVLHLHEIKARLDAMLEREGRTELAAKVNAFLPVRAELDLAGWPETDIFAHS